MKQRLSLMILSVILVISVTGCSAKFTNAKKGTETEQPSQKMVVVVVDKKTKAPVKDAKVYMVGNENAYATDEMGKTQEINVEINKDYFEKYNDEVRNKVGAGFVNIVVVKEGYGKHMELDYAIYPGNSTAIAKVEISSGNKATKNINKPVSNYVENLVRSYEKFEGQGARNEAATKYKVVLKDEENKPIEGAKIVVPEALSSANTDKKGTCELSVPMDATSKVNYPVKKNYGEITVLAYKEGYAYGAYLKVHVNQDGKDNILEIKLKKTKSFKVDYTVAEPGQKWMDELLSTYN